MTKHNLKPCPKCGGEPELFYNQFGDRRIPGIKCKRCGHLKQQWFWNEERLVEVWNTWRREKEEHEID